MFRPVGRWLDPSTSLQGHSAVQSLPRPRIEAQAELLLWWCAESSMSCKHIPSCVGCKPWGMRYDSSWCAAQSSSGMVQLPEDLMPEPPQGFAGRSLGSSGFPSVDTLPSNGALPLTRLLI